MLRENKSFLNEKRPSYTHKVSPCCGQLVEFKAKRVKIEQTDAEHWQIALACDSCEKYYVQTTFLRLFSYFKQKDEVSYQKYLESLKIP